ncbi:MAG: glycosyltransferase family 2 protein [Clostridiales bacterium]|nr:glycosyltransferase family 2 protein [Clostridiales bacterium]
MTLGLSMIVKNESKVLARALDGIKDVVDEIVIVDTGSTDNTVNIARQYTDKVYTFPWINDFSAARNFGLSKLTTDFVMWLDADDTVPEATARQIAKLMRSNSVTADIVMMPYVTATDEQGKPTFAYHRERILKNVPQNRFKGAVHEAVELNGKVITLSSPIIHSKPADRNNGTRNLDIYEGLIAGGHTLTPRERYYYARELFYNNRTTDAAKEFARFIGGDGGFSANKADACLLLSKCYVDMGDGESAMQAALYRFAFSEPDGEGCCAVASLFFERGDYTTAAYWYNLALHTKPNINSGAFVQPDYYGFIPLIWLTVCYDKLGNIKKAYGYHRRAKKIRPSDKSVAANDAYFASKGFKDA